MRFLLADRQLRECPLYWASKKQVPSHTCMRWFKCRRTDKLSPTGCLPVSSATGLGLPDADSRHPHECCSTYQGCQQHAPPALKIFVHQESWARGRAHPVLLLGDTLPHRTPASLSVTRDLVKAVFQDPENVCCQAGGSTCGYSFLPP